MSRGTVLIVDDDVIVRSVLRRELVGMGLDVLQAATGALALQELRLQPVRLMLLDYTLPDMTGLDVLHSLPSDQAGRLIVIVITSSTDRGVYDSVISGPVPVYDYMEKPIDLKALRTSVNEIFGSWTSK